MCVTTILNRKYIVLFQVAHKRTCLPVQQIKMERDAPQAPSPCLVSKYLPFLEETAPSLLPKFSSEKASSPSKKCSVLRNLLVQGHDNSAKHYDLSSSACSSPLSRSDSSPSCSPSSKTDLSELSFDDASCEALNNSEMELNSIVDMSIPSSPEEEAESITVSITDSPQREAFYSQRSARTRTESFPSKSISRQRYVIDTESPRLVQKDSSHVLIRDTFASDDSPQFIESSQLLSSDDSNPHVLARDSCSRLITDSSQRVILRDSLENFRRVESPRILTQGSPDGSPESQHVLVPCQMPLLVRRSPGSQVRLLQLAPSSRVPSRNVLRYANVVPKVYL